MITTSCIIDGWCDYNGRESAQHGLQRTLWNTGQQKGGLFFVGGYRGYSGFGVTIFNGSELLGCH